MLQRITTDPNVMGGVPCIRGLRVTVNMLAGMLRAGKSDEELIALYPYIEPEDLDAVRQYEAAQYFTCPSCGSHYYGRDTTESEGQVITLKTVRCHGGWSSSDPQVTVCHWRGEWPKKGPGQPKKGNVRFTAHITPATHKQILSRQKPGQTLGQVIDSAFQTEPTQKV